MTNQMASIICSSDHISHVNWIELKRDNLSVCPKLNSPIFFLIPMIKCVSNLVLHLIEGRYIVTKRILGYVYSRNWIDNVSTCAQPAVLITLSAVVRSE